MNRVEAILVSATLIAVAMNIFRIPGGNMLCVLLFPALGIFYIVRGIVAGLVPKENGSKSPLRVVAGIASGSAVFIVVTGVLFKLLRWPGGLYMLMAGTSSLFIILIISVVKYVQTHANYYQQILHRLSAICGIGLFMVYIPNAKIVAFKYRNYPEYVKIYKEYAADPMNKELEEKEREALRNLK